MLWQAPKHFPMLKANVVHIWRASLVGTAADLAEFAALLNPQERERAAKFVIKGVGDRFILARGILRKLLAKYLEVDPRDLVFQQNRYGKLYLGSSRLQFNISHSRDMGLFVFALDRPVGIDVEFMREQFEFKEIAQKFFSNEEIADLFSLVPAQQTQAFFNCWSRKEAFIKALGVGLFCSLDSFAVEVSSAKWGKLQLAYTKSVEDIALDVAVESWSLEALNPAAGYAGAFVIGLAEYGTNFYDFN